MKRKGRKQIVVGSRVRYSRMFCQSTGMYTGDVPHARGTVTELVPLGSEIMLACINWDGGFNVPEKVNVENLSLIGSIEL